MGTDIRENSILTMHAHQHDAKDHSAIKSLMFASHDCVQAIIYFVCNKTNLNNLKATWITLSRRAGHS